ncbi:MAG TPA: 4Fe-4S binding protein [Acidobacteriaceae bacterium]|jgi:polyferredoxin|nr:4Fe-4S binding protein [Acidobacteriaceae bacterium]
MNTQMADAVVAHEVQRKKKVVRRAAPDGSQKLRRVVQLVFVALNVWIGAQFFLWVRWFEHGGQGWAVGRPAGVEGWLPIAGLMNLKYMLVTRQVPGVHPAAMFLLIAFLGISVLLKKAFCGWLCPVGSASEMLWKLGRKVFGRNFAVPRWLDRELRGLKYLLLGFFFFVIAWMPAEALRDFMSGPYGTIADVKMLDFFRTIGVVGMVVMASLVALSVLIQNFWCRYLCPYGAMMGLVSLLSPVKIRRDAEACIDCGKCNKACPSHLTIDKLVQIRSAECTACMACVASCPVENALQFALPARNAETAAERWRARGLRPQAVAAMLAVIFLGVVVYARMAGHWQTVVPQDVYMQLVPHANEVSHPM